MGTDNTILDKIKKSIHSSDPNAEAYLFGSRARGNNRPDSDWDILILVDNKKVTNEIDDIFREKINDIELETSQAISVFIYPKEYWKGTLKFSPLYDAVMKEGIVL